MVICVNKNTGVFTDEKTFINFLNNLLKKYKVEKVYNKTNTLIISKYKEIINSQNIKVISITILYKNNNYLNYQWFGKIKYMLSIDDNLCNFSGYLTEVNNLTIGLYFEDIINMLIKKKVFFDVSQKSIKLSRKK